MHQIDDIAEYLGRHQPALRKVDPPLRQAAVAVVLSETEQGPELLFIERARYKEDPWSGHMAFPGGRLDPGDAGPRAAAERETREEVGLSLGEARHLGRLDDLEGRQAGRPAGLVISAHVFHLQERAPLSPNYEVESAFWFPLSELLVPERHVDYQPQREGASPYPGILVGEPERHVVWGLTYRFLELFLDAVGTPLPERWRTEHR